MRCTTIVPWVRDRNCRALVVGMLTAALAGCSANESTSAAPPVTPPPTPSTPTTPSPGGRADFLPGIPAGWGGGTTRSDLYELGLDVGEKRSGTGAGYIRSRTTSSGTEASGMISQSLNAAPYRGKRVRLSAWVAADSIVSGGGGLWMRVDGPSRRLGFDNMIDFDRPISGTMAWHQVAVVLDVPEEAIGIAVGAMFSGRGVLRVDDFAIDTVAASVPVTGSAATQPYAADSTAAIAAALRYPLTMSNTDFEGLKPVPASTIAWLSSAAVPFDTDAAGNGWDDLAELGRIVGSARIIGFGEATHGTREFFRMKHRAFEYLVERHGVTWFTIEATMPESRDVDRFVTQGIGDPRALLSRLQFWTWNTQEVLDIIVWMREYNKRAGAPRLRFLGFDMQSADVSLDSVRAITTRLDDALAERATRITGCLNGARSASSGRISSALYKSNLRDSTRQMCNDSVAALHAAIASSHRALSAKSDRETADWLQQYALLLVQWTQTASAMDNSGTYLRDQFMADNLAWAVNRDPNSKYFAWAHNGHVGRRFRQMGYHLGKQFGNDYRVFGFTFGTGQFNAYELFSNTVGALRTHTITSVDTTSIEHLFELVNQPRLILDARKIPDGGSAAAPLRNGAVRMRQIGSAYNNVYSSSFFESAMLPADYDALIWFSITTASVLLPFQ